jgi:hypothetical protein
MPAAAAAVAIFINGCQVLLPTAAFQRGDTVMVPVKGVFDRLGAVVSWVPGARQVLITGPGLRLALTLDSTAATLNEQPLTLQAAPELVEGNALVPLRLVTQALGVDIAWDQPRRRVYLQTRPLGPPLLTTIAALLERPHEWAGRLVLLIGEYLGWQPSPFSPATRNGTPVSRCDWVLRDATGEIYCRGDVRVPAPFALSPYSNVGRRLMVAGVAKVARSGFIFVEPREMAEPPPPDGLICTVTTSRRTFAEGEPLRIRLRLANPFSAPVRLTSRGPCDHEIVIRNREGKEVWRLSTASPPGPPPHVLDLAPGDGRQVEEVWHPSWAGGAPLPPGRYTVEGEWAGVQGSYPHLIAVVPRQP